MNSTIFGPFVEIVGIASMNFVKYFIGVIINLWPPKEIGEIWPIKSSAHLENGHNDYMGFNVFEGWIKKFACCWHLTHFLMYSMQSNSIVGQ